MLEKKNRRRIKRQSIVLSVVVVMIILGLFMYRSKTVQKTEMSIIPETFYSPQQIFTRVELLDFTAGKISEEEKAQLLDGLENAFNEQCSDLNIPSDKCSPYVIYSYVLTRERLGILPGAIHTNLSSKALDLWKDYYENVEFNKEGYVIGKDQGLDHNSISQFYYFITLIPESEKDFWFEKLSGVSPADIYKRFDLLRVYRYYFKASNLSQIPQDMTTSQDVENLCYNNLFIEEDSDVCEVLYYFQIKDFCEINITSEEISIAQEKIEMESTNQLMQSCKMALQKSLS